MRHRPRSARSRKLLAPLVLTLLVTTILFAQSAFAAACSKKNPCTAVFIAGPADAALNGGTTSENITSEAFAPGGAPLRVQVRDAAGAPRGGISITLQLSPSQGGLSGAITATSDANGVATFDGTANPITIKNTALGYTMTPTGSNVVGTASGPFGIFTEGEVCSDSPGQCVVGDDISDSRVDATVTASNTGTLGVLVRAASIDCAGVTALSSSEIAWKFTGTDAQIVTADLAKSLIKQFVDRGAPIPVCFQADPGKRSWTDAFGQVVPRTDPATGQVITTGQLATCNSTTVMNCIISETASSGGGRLITFTVNDGKGRI
jgi:hypothetical protein